MVAAMLIGTALHRDCHCLLWPGWLRRHHIHRAAISCTLPFNLMQVSFGHACHVWGFHFQSLPSCVFFLHASHPNRVVPCIKEACPGFHCFWCMGSDRVWTTSAAHWLYEWYPWLRCSHSLWNLFFYLRKFSVLVQVWRVQVLLKKYFN